MVVERYIYTRLSAEQSPKKTTGFQSAFMPSGLHKKIHTVSLESHVHLPTVSNVLEKRSVFFLEIDREHWQVILFVKALPLARDEFGRGGIFLAQGFIIPPQVWQRYTNPLRLSAALEHECFLSIEELLASSEVDRAKGLISPLDLGVLPEGDAERNDLELSPLDRSALILLCKILSGNSKGLAMVYEGGPKAAEQHFAKWAGFLPAAWKAKLAWDSSFDGGKLFFAPHNCVAYTESPPVTGKQAIYEPKQGRLRFSEPNIEEETKAFDPYTHWIEQCRDQDLSFERIEAHWQFSEAIQTGRAFSGLPPSTCFCQTNVHSIRAWLKKGTDPLLPAAWREVLAENLRDDEIIRMAAGGFQDKMLATAIAQAILHRGLYPGNFKHSPPLILMNKGDVRFNALCCMWSKQPVNAHWLLDINVAEREQILTLFAKNGMTQEDAKTLGFLEEEIQTAQAHFHGSLKRLWKRITG